MSESCPHCHHRPPRKIGSEPYLYLEARDENGVLLLGDHPQPPFAVTTLTQLTDHYFQKNPTVESVSVDTIRSWYAAQGWRWRPKTW